MENEEPKSADEIKLREWLSANDVYPAQEDMQSMVINSFYSQFEEEPAMTMLFHWMKLTWMP
jgi:hypothetical protein